MPQAASLRRPSAEIQSVVHAGARRSVMRGVPRPAAAARSEAPLRFVAAPRVACPRCGSGDTERLSAFGATACKALHRCRACREPFEHFKPI